MMTKRKLMRTLRITNQKKDKADEDHSNTSSSTKNDKSNADSKNDSDDSTNETSGSERNN